MWEAEIFYGRFKYRGQVYTVMGVRREDREGAQVTVEEDDPTVNLQGLAEYIKRKLRRNGFDVVRIRPISAKEIASLMQYIEHRNNPRGLNG